NAWRPRCVASSLAWRTLLLGREDHRELFAFEFRGRLHLGQIGQGLGDTRHYLLTQLRMRDLSPPEHQGHLHLVSLFEEAPRVADLRLEVVLVDPGAEFDFLQ